MNKKMRELRDSISKKLADAQTILDGDNADFAAAEKLIDEADELQKQFDIAARLEAAGKAVVETVAPATPQPDGAVKEFASAARKGFRVKSMNETTPADGGYTVPQDIVTTIQHLREAKASLLNYVSIVPVTTNSGARTFKTRAQQTGFTKVGEGAAIGEKATPQFTRLEYNIEKYAGYFPVTSELLADSDANIAGELTQWIADESRVTANKLILEAVATAGEVAIADLDDIKTAINVTLGAAFKPSCVIITNDDGLNWLDTLKDADGKYLLQPNPTQPAAMQLCAGASVIPVSVIPNADMPTDANKIPMIIGDLSEGIIYWDRQQMTIKTSDVAAIGDFNAFEDDLVLFRAIEREDVTVKDSAAFVNGKITVAGA